uniref:Uncharacterized protein n=1 Tax=Prymnesium polylepis TaxID=72548 RepID=A0A6V4I0R1_9EUKA
MRALGFRVRVYFFLLEAGFFAIVFFGFSPSVLGARYELALGKEPFSSLPSATRPSIAFLKTGAATALPRSSVTLALMDGCVAPLPKNDFAFTASMIESFTDAGI